MPAIIAIPAREHSTRLPGKLLLQETGKPLIQHTIDAAKECDLPVAVLTDSEEIAAVAKKAMVHSVIDPKSEFRNGTERIYGGLRALCAEKKTAPGGEDVVVHWQADEPELTPSHIRTLVEALTAIPGCDVATLMADAALEDQANPDVVKVRRGPGGYATQFSRMPLANGRRHIGVYAYRARYLDWYVANRPSFDEEALSLEQLRALDHGLRIRVDHVEHPYPGIDTRADYEAFVSRCAGD